ncbi:hypothetical protein DKT69_01115 [Micromonospora sicca]|uniref:Uncharacterized protein n=1 Tax=Micromonospora sicca TaxID=2202420 RepID=A0A317DTR8_9ACTN|nr:hypothetical protein [Micromonospora sp. 4G51]PWR17266.1 hypothetical protein DKT69_01115 [Micromonospora sp. 4G51]
MSVASQVEVGLQRLQQHLVGFVAQQPAQSRVHPRDVQVPGVHAGQQAVDSQLGPVDDWTESGQVGAHPGRLEGCARLPRIDDTLTSVFDQRRPVDLLLRGWPGGVDAPTLDGKLRELVLAL